MCALLMRNALTLTGLLFVLLCGLLHVSKARAATALSASRSTRTATAASVSKAARVVKVALGQRGAHYHWAGTSPRTGFDCSGFTRWVYAHVGVSLPHSSYAQYGLGRRVGGHLKPGDLLFFYGLGHVGIYVGHGRYIDAPQTGDVVHVRPLSRGDLDGARRLF